MYKTAIIITVLLINNISFGQVDAGEDITMSAGLPVKLTGIFQGYVGIPVTAADDYFVGPFNIGFDFTYFGNTFTQFAISPNGLLSFHVPDIIGQSFQDPTPIPNNDLIETIMCPYQDLFKRPISPHNNYIYYRTVGEEPNRKLIAGWCEAPMYGCNSLFATYQIVLNEGDNTIVNHIISKPQCSYLGNKATQGLNNSYNIGVAVPGRNNISWTAQYESWLFEPDGTDNYIISNVSFEPEVIGPQGKLKWAWYKDNPGGELLSTEQSLLIHPMESTTYYVEITLCSGIKYNDDIYVKVIPIPNAFNPDSPVEQNRKFKVFANPDDNINNFRMYIFNRWGQKIFDTDDIDEGWDGTINGMPASAGVYVWVVYYEGEEGEEITNKGSVNLVR
ncbi:MAG: hypothetical protein B6D61_10980 [Bacteroidetes bacterium 4484_249]|nr:MAG: hypothetical protein B6D61_10980 [Bacteroidetes bacterium 4484_249]